MRTNPEISTRHAHAIALQVVALQDFTAASPMGPAPNYQITNLNAPQQRQVPQYSQQQRQQTQQQQTQQQTSPGGGRTNLGDLNDPHNPYSPLHPNHPLYRQYGGSQEGHVDPLGQPGDFVSQFGGRNPLEEHAYSQGYRGQYPHSYAAADLLAHKALDFFKNRPNLDGSGPLTPGQAAPVRVAPPATRNGKPGRPGARVMP
jgi:hypothetical protein